MVSETASRSKRQAVTLAHQEHEVVVLGLLDSMKVSMTSIVVGMITTIIVAISATDYGKDRIEIRILAIVLPALTTAAAAAFAFYGPQFAWSQAARTLSSLSYLHGQMALEIWEVEADDRDGLAKKLADWSKRFLDIQTIAAATEQGRDQQAGREARTGPSATGTGGGALGGSGSAPGRG
jgi:hypothetical protein